MRFYKKAVALVESGFPRFGLNKKREVIRLLCEISKRENISPEKIVPNINQNKFYDAKKYLLKRRFPYAYSHDELSAPYLPSIRLKSSESLAIKEKIFHPKKIFIEKSVRTSYVANKFKEAFQDAVFLEIESLKDYLKKNRHFTISDYNNRHNSVFIINERYDFFKKCPCTKSAESCGYHVFNLGFGCIFECTYCYLQQYVNSPGLIFPANVDDYFNAFNSYKRAGMRIGTGEFSDSLMLDDINEYSVSIIDFFKKQKDVMFEFKTKSSNIGNLLKTKHSGNIVASWSLNPQSIIDTNEFYTASLAERLDAAMQCVEAGYKVAFHFDPVFYYEGWEKDYEQVIAELFTKIKLKHIAWISIGTLRFNPELKKIIETRFPENTILDAELIPGYDNKLRYPYSMRYNIYKSIIDMMRKHHEKAPIYLCMEERSIWRALNLTLPFIKT